jgi:hypothetical protein
VEDILVTIEVNSIDLSNQKNLYSSNGLFELQCSISMNAQDFASMKESSKEKEKENKEKDPSAPPVEKPAETVPISSLCHSFNPKMISPNYYSLSSLFYLMEIMENHQKEDTENNVNLGEFNPFNPEANLIQQQREEKYHSFDQKVIMNGESFFPANKLPKGSHIKAVTNHIILQPLASLASTGNETEDLSPQQEEAMKNAVSNQIIIMKNDITNNLQDLLIHCESNSQCSFICNYHYLLELYHLLITTQADLKEKLLNYVIVLQFQFYLEYPPGHSSHYYQQQQQQQPQSQFSPRAHHGSTNEKVLLSPERMVITLFKDFNITLEPSCLPKIRAVKVSPPANETEEGNDEVKEMEDQVAKEVEEDLINLLPVEGLLGFPVQPTSFSAFVSFPDLSVENQTCDCPSYPLPSSSVIFNALSTSEGVVNYYRYLVQCPSYSKFLQYLHRTLANSSTGLPESITSAEELQPFVKKIVVNFSYKESVQEGNVAMSAPLYYYSSLSQYSVQTPPPKGGFPAGSSVGLILEEYLPSNIGLSILARIRGNDEQKAHITPAIMSEIINPTTSAPQLVVAIILPDNNKLTEIGPVMNGKEKTFYIDLAVNSGSVKEEEIHFDSAVTPLIVVK